MSHTVFTIGHSRHTADHFVDLLRTHQITRLVDVRSQPRSRWSPQFGQSALVRLLAARAIEYVYLGTQLGGRPADRSCYRPDGSVNFALRATAPDFADGIAQLVPIARSYRTAILCAEEDPAKCHRRLLVGTAMTLSGFTVIHIRGDARLEREAAVAPTRQIGLF